MSSLGVDLRDWFRPGSGVTVRYLLARLRWVDRDSPIARSLREADDEQTTTTKPTTARLRERAAQIEAERREAAGG